MWIWRKMEKISWTAKVSNSEVLNQVKENSCIINTINQRKRRWLGHVLRHDVLLRDILEGRMTGKCMRGRKSLHLMRNICEGYETAKKRAEDRCLWCAAVMGVSDLLNDRIQEIITSGWHSQKATCNMFQLRPNISFLLPVKNKLCHHAKILTSTFVDFVSVGRLLLCQYELECLENYKIYN